MHEATLKEAREKMEVALDYTTAAAAIEYVASTLPAYLGLYWKNRYATEAYRQIMAEG